MAERELNFIGNVVRNLALHIQEVFLLTVVFPRPNVRLVFHLNQLAGDANLLRITADTALKNILHTQLATDLVQWSCTILVVHHRRARDYTEALGIQIAQLRDHFFGKAVAEIILVGISGQVLEGQDRQHDSSGRWLSRSRSGPRNPNSRPDENDHQDGSQDKPEFLAWSYGRSRP